MSPKPKEQEQQQQEEQQRNSQDTSTCVRIKEAMREIDLIIRNLGDNAPIIVSKDNGNMHASVNSRKRKCPSGSVSASNINNGKDINTNGPVDKAYDSDSDLEWDPCSFAPVGLEEQYNELYNLLEKGLIGIKEDDDSDIFHKTNVSALLMGARGQGKSLVLERCLMALRKKATLRKNRWRQDGNKDCSEGGDGGDGDGAHFRVVHLNGILLRGQNVAVVVQEIVSQLCQIVAEERRISHERTNVKNGNKQKQDTETDATAATSRKIQKELQALMQKEAHRFRTRQTNFNSSMACLNEAFQISCVDSIPILIVLDELDSFLPKKKTQRNPLSKGARSLRGRTRARDGGTDAATSSRDLLLYHLLDRISGKGSLLSLVGICARLTTTNSYEKRVRSRAQGTSKIVYFNYKRVWSEKYEVDNGMKKVDVYETLVDTLLSNFDVLDFSTKKITNSEDDDCGDSKHPKERFSIVLKQRIKGILLPQSMDKTPTFCRNSSANEIEMDKQYKIHDQFRLNQECGKTIRWFCRVMSVSLTLYAAELQDAQIVNVNDSPSIPVFRDTHLMEGLKVMGADAFIPQTTPGARYGRGDRNGDGDDNDDSNNYELTDITPRIRDLMDLSGSQVAVLLSAKRILRRDAQNRDSDSRISSTPLTYERIRKEYESYFLAQGKSSGPDRYDEVVFFKSFVQMLGSIFSPARDHTGEGPHQYYYSRKYSAVGMSHDLLKKTSLHVGIHMERDLMPALAANKLKCSIALKDWAK